MAPRKRRKDRKDWPANLHAAPRADGRQYFYYLRPDLPKDHPERFCKMGYVSESEAKDAARQLNQVFAPGGPLASRIIAKAKGEQVDTIGDWCDKMTADVLKKRRINGHPLSARTLDEYGRLYRNIKADEIGKLPMEGAEQKDLADFLEKVGSTAEVFNKYRTRLIDLYANAISAGVRVDNLPARILPADKDAKKRKRITLPGDKPGAVGIDGIDAYRAIWEMADHATRCAMELELNALQRREEIHSWRHDWSREEVHDGQRERWVYIRISKTHKHGVAAYVRIPESMPVVHSEFGAKTLGELIRKCASDGVLCPYLVHRRPKRVKKAKDRSHPFQLTASQISRGFAEARDAAGIYAHLPPEQRPTFHELIALGEHLRIKQGWAVQQIQRLRGHTKESTTVLYLEGHEWQTVEFPKGSTGA